MFQRNVIGRVTILILCLVVSLIGTTSRGQQLNDDPSSRRISNFIEHDCNIHQVLSDLADTYEVPIGFEESTAFDGRPTPSIRIDIKSGTIQDVLNLLVNADPRYEWKTVNGVINVYPKLKQDNVLDVVIPSFKADTHSKASLREAIADLPQVKARMRKLGVRPLQFQFGGMVGAPYARIVLSMKNSSLREILNEISKQTAEHYWIVNRFGKKHEFLIVNF
jgi:hypothetical protein